MSWARDNEWQQSLGLRASGRACNRLSNVDKCYCMPQLRKRTGQTHPPFFFPLLFNGKSRKTALDAISGLPSGCLHDRWTSEFPDDMWIPLINDVLLFCSPYRRSWWHRRTFLEKSLFVLLVLSFIVTTVMIIVAASHARMLSEWWSNTYLILSITRESIKQRTTM